MTPAEHEAHIAHMEFELLTAETREARAAWCVFFLNAIRERNEARTPDEVRQLELDRGLC